MASYYHVDAILTDAQKVPCTFELTVPGLGYLEGNMTGDMKQGSKVELPLWLGEMLALRYNRLQIYYQFLLFTLSTAKA
jgi:GINS complex subunit 3